MYQTPELIFAVFPRPNNETLDAEYHARVLTSDHTGNVAERPDLKKWLVRRVECMRGHVDVDVEMMPAFSRSSDPVLRSVSDGLTDYARDEHSTSIVRLSNSQHNQCRQRVVFKSEGLSLELNATTDCGDDTGNPHPEIVFELISNPTALGNGVAATFRLYEGQAVSFILRDAEDHVPDAISTALVDEVQTATHAYWARWMKGSSYMGRWEQAVTRSLLLLKMLIFEPSGAIVAAPTFSLPENIGGDAYFEAVLP